MPADVLSVYVSFLWEMCALPRFHGDHCPPGLTDEAGQAARVQLQDVWRKSRP
jgi:hypothetical protein